jgi:hypothetical protein
VHSELTGTSSCSGVIHFSLISFPPFLGVGPRHHDRVEVSSQARAWPIQGRQGALPGAGRAVRKSLAGWQAVVVITGSVGGAGAGVAGNRRSTVAGLTGTIRAGAAPVGIAGVEAQSGGKPVIRRLNTCRRAAARQGRKIFVANGQLIRFRTDPTPSPRAAAVIRITRAQLSSLVAGELHAGLFLSGPAALDAVRVGGGKALSPACPQRAVRPGDANLA